MLDFDGTSELVALVAVGGNSRAARSVRAKLQWRDRYGRFVDMGRGIKFKIRLGDGTVRSVNGTFVGAIDSETGQVYVQNDPSGLTDGFYQVKSGNAQEILGSISEAELNKRGITLGKHADGSSITDRADEDIPNIDAIPFADAPEGWSRKEDKVGAQVWESEDGAFRLYHNYKFIKGKQTEQWGVEDVQRNPGRVQNWKGIGFALQQVEKNDNLPEPDGLNNQQRVAALKEDNAARRNALAALNDPAVPLSQRIADYDENGAVANLINNGAPGAEVLDALRKNAKWSAIENDLANPADFRSPDQKSRDAIFEKLRNEINGLKGGDSATPASPDAAAPAVDAPAAPDAPTVPGVDGADAGLELRGVAAQGFLIPTNKVGTDISPEGLAAHIEANRDFLGEGGKRLIIDTDAGTVDIANSAADLNDAKAQAGGIGAAEFYDLAANKTVSNDKNVGAPNGDQNSSGSTGEPLPNDTGSGAPVQPADPATAGPDNTPTAPAGDADALGEPIPADRAGLTQRLAYLERARGRVGADSPRFEATHEAYDDIKARLDAFVDPVEAPAAPEKPQESVASTPATPAVPEAPAAPESATTPPAQDDRLARLESELEALKAERDNAVQAKDAAGQNADAGLMSRVDIAKEDVAGLEQVVQNAKEQIANVANDSLDELRAKLAGDPAPEKQGNPEGSQAILNKLAELDQKINQISKPESAPAPLPTTNLDTKKEPNNGGTDNGRNPSTISEGVPARGSDGRGGSGGDQPGPAVGRKIDRPARWDALEAQGLATPDIFELEATPENAQKFHDAISVLKENNPFAASVHVYDAEEYLSMRLFITEDGTAGVAIKDGDDLVSGFVQGDSPHKGAFRAVLSAGIAEGGTRGDAFDTVLPGIYAMEGFVPVARMPFNPEFAPDGWDPEVYKKYNNGQPDVVFLQYQPERVDSAYVPGEGTVVDDYDKGIAIARGEVPAEAVSTAGSNGGLPDPSLMSWNELNAELGKPIDPKSDTLREDLARYAAVQDEFFKVRGGYRTPTAERDQRPGLNSVPEPVFAPKSEAPAPVASPKPQAPDVPSEPPVDVPAPATPEDGGDGLPDNISELEAMAGAMEREIAAARPARQKVLREQADRIYDKIEAQTPVDNSDNNRSDPSAYDPFVPNTAERALLEPTADEQAVIDNLAARGAGLPGDYNQQDARDEAQSAIFHNTVAGKDLTPEEQNQVIEWDDLTPEQRAKLVRAINAAPNAANTVTKPRPVEQRPAALVQVTPELMAVETNPDEIVDPNLIMADVRKNHPDHTELANGDLVIESQVVNGKLYEVIVRRTKKERFFAYIMETDENGNRRASRLQVDTHSYAALRTKIGKGKSLLRNHPDMTKWLNRRGNRENLGKEDLGDNTLGQYIDGTNIPYSENEVFNKVVAGIANMAAQSNVQRFFLDALADVAGQKPEFVDMVLEAVNARKILDAQAKVNVVPEGQKESHISVDGTKLKVGDWVDWTDDKKTRPVKDEFGNTVYQTDENGAFILRYGKKVAVNEPNPDYGEVFRGRVAQLREKTNDGQYVYSDSTYVVFPDLNAQAGRKPSHQISRVGSQLKIVEGQNAPASERFFARKIEKRNQEGVAGAAGVPANGGARTKPVAPVAADVGIDEQNGVGRVAGFPDVAVPQDQFDAAVIAQDAEPISLRASDLVAGDLIPGIADNGAPIFDAVLEVTPQGDGRTLVRVVRLIDGKNEIRERTLAAEKVLAFRPAPVAPVERIENPPIENIKIGDKLAINNVPGAARVEGWTQGVEPGREDWMFQVRGDDNEMYFVRGDEIAPPAQGVPELPEREAPAKPWHNDPASTKQVQALKRIRASRKLSTAEAVRIDQAINNPNITKKEASDLIGEFGPRAKAGAPIDPLASMNEFVNALRDKKALDAAQAEAIKGAIAQDVANPAEPDKYEGEVVKKIVWSNIKYGGGRAPFENVAFMKGSELNAGDLLPVGVGHRRIYLQILDNQGGDTVRVRMVGQTPYTRTRLNGVIRVDGEVFSIRVGYGRNIKRPTAFAAKDYFIDPTKLPAVRPRRGAAFVPPLPEPADPKLAERIIERGQKLVDRYLNGHTVIAQGPRGADAERADIVDAGGMKLFVKGIKGRGGGLWDGDQQVKNEIIANRVAQALGIEDIQMGFHMDEDNNRLLVMNLIEGSPAAGHPNWAQEIKNNMWDIPNAWRMGILDFIVKNRDRHDGNWMIKPDKTPVAIDHGRVSFSGSAHYSAFADKLIRDLNNGSAPITSADLLRLKSNLNMLRSEFASMGMNSQFANMMTYMDQLIGKATK